VTESLRLRVRPPASTGAVWRAPTDAEALRGRLAEHAETVRLLGPLRRYHEFDGWSPIWARDT
jgi:hypothetical protein